VAHQSPVYATSEAGAFSPWTQNVIGKIQSTQESHPHRRLACFTATCSTILGAKLSPHGFPRRFDLGRNRGLDSDGDGDMADSQSPRSSNEFGATTTTTITMGTTATFLSPPGKNLTRSSTVPSNLNAQRHRSHLAPEDAFCTTSPPRRLRLKDDGDSPVMRRRRKPDAGGSAGIDGRNRSRKRRRSWKKLLWVDRTCRCPADEGVSPRN